MSGSLFYVTSSGLLCVMRSASFVPSLPQYHHRSLLSHLALIWFPLPSVQRAFVARSWSSRFLEPANFCETHRAAAFLLPSAFIIRCRATHRDEYLLPVIYWSLFLHATHLRSFCLCAPSFPFRCVPFVSPGPPPTRALINFLDGAHYRPDCRQIPTPRRDT